MEKITAPIEEAALYTHRNNNTKKVSSTDNKVRRSIKKVLPKLSKARKRLLLHLLFNGPSTTGALCSACSIGNLSDAVIKMNPALKRSGLLIINYAPPKPLVNVFGEKTPVHMWELVSIHG
tara:strand:+ start:3746 stop:4108 length:363 start_codon:yes stop_codon:yes gene_type:complete